MIIPDYDKNALLYYQKTIISDDNFIQIPQFPINFSRSRSLSRYRWFYPIQSLAILI